jgi:hypothetical protein
MVFSGESLIAWKRGRMDKTEIQNRVSEIQWFHNYELIPGVVTNGLNPISEYAPYFEIPQDLTGKRVLDIGCAEGYFTFLAESRGADVVAIDSWIREGFFLAHEVLNSKAEFHHMSVYNIHPNTQTKGAILISGWALSQLEPKGGIERITIYLDNLDDPESRLGEARYGVPRPDLKSSVSRQYGNVGFEFTCDMSTISQGCHTLYALVEGKENWRYTSVPITIGPSETNRDSSVDTQVPDALVEQHQTNVPSPVDEHSVLADYNAEIVRLRKLVDGYEQGRFMRLMRFLHNLRQGK